MLKPNPITFTKYFIVLIIASSFCSCIVTAPRYSTIDRVSKLKVGMSEKAVSDSLGIEPYYAKAVTNKETVLLYKYRVNDRATVPFFMNGTNGKTILGKYINLLVTYDTAGVARRFESCDDCDKTYVETSKVDVNKVITFLTITVPLLLVYVGIKVYH